MTSPRTVGWLRGAALALVLLLWSSAATAAAAYLTAEAVLASSATHYPSIIESLARRRGAEGKVLEADGAFDLVFAADGFSHLTGFYDGTAVKGGVRRALPTLGTSVFADYKLSDGIFPLYEDVNYTSDRGEVKVGALFSLLRDRDIDDERFEQTDAALSLRAAELDVLLTRVGVQQRALIAYWRWVAAGRTLDVYSNLLEIARDREAGLEEQVESGAQASIFLVENRQNITRRETFVASALRDFRIAANELAMFYRDADGRPRAPEASELPPTPPIGAGESRQAPLQPDAAAALARRPELALLATAIERAENRRMLASNAMKPRVDVTVELARDFGSVVEGGPSRASSDARVGLAFSVPMQQRVARGKVQQEQAAIAALLAEQQLKQEQIELEIENIVLDIDVADELLQLAIAQVEQTELVRAAEQRRFENGASDFFIVNVREEAVANARIQYLLADLERRIARANYDAAIVDLERLGIDDRR
jgi:outer membrane protein TolC